MRRRDTSLGTSVLLTIALLTVVGHAAPFAPAGEIEEALIGRGYENVAIRHGQAEVTVWCENRVVRFTSLWIVEALAITAKRVSPETRVRVVAQRHGRPVIEVGARAGDVVGWLERRLTSDQFEDRLSAAYAGGEAAPQTRNRSMRRTDVELGPGWVLAQVNLPDERYAKINFDARATVTSTIMPGTFGTAQMYVPIYNYNGAVDGDRRFREVRPGTMAIGVIQPLGTSAFAVGTVGYYDYGSSAYDSYGAVIDVKHFTSDGHWYFGVNVGYLGQSSYVIEVENGSVRRLWDIRYPMQRHPYFAEVGYRFSGIDLRVDARWGRFLLGDKGWRVDIRRKFGEVGLTVFGLRTDARMYGGLNPPESRDRRLLGGLRLEIPLPPKRRGMPAALRVTTGQTFRWQLRYRVGQIGAGLPYEYSVDGMIGECSPVVITNNLERVRTQIAGIASE